MCLAPGKKWRVLDKKSLLVITRSNLRRVLQEDFGKIWPDWYFRRPVKNLMPSARKSLKIFYSFFLF